MAIPHPQTCGAITLTFVGMGKLVTDLAGSFPAWANALEPVLADASYLIACIAGIMTIVSVWRKKHDKSDSSK